MDGFLLIDKPIGISSFGIVAKVRGTIRAETGQKVKIGHTGTLDPAASGLLILVLGKHTKRAGQFSKLDKTYVVEATLGATSTTGDSEGQILPAGGHRPTTGEVESALNSFVGKIEQVPPAFSAIKVNGQRAYKLARAGNEVKIAPRQVSIYSLEDIKYDYPKLSFVTEVSSGTYIRTLVEDIGLKLGAGAYMSALCRIKIANYNIANAIELEPLNLKVIQANLQK